MLLQDQITETVETIEEGIESDTLDFQMLCLRNQHAIMEVLVEEQQTCAVTSMPDKKGRNEEEYICEKCNANFQIATPDWTFDKTHEVWIHWVEARQICGMTKLKPSPNSNDR